MGLQRQVLGPAPRRCQGLLTMAHLAWAPGLPIQPQTMIVLTAACSSSSRGWRSSRGSRWASSRFSLGYKQRALMGKGGIRCLHPFYTFPASWSLEYGGQYGSDGGDCSTTIATRGAWRGRAWLYTDWGRVLPWGWETPRKDCTRILPPIGAAHRTSLGLEVSSSVKWVSTCLIFT